MGRQSRIRKTRKTLREAGVEKEKTNDIRARNVHMKKFAGGAISPRDLHVALGIRKKCMECGLPAVIRCKVFVEIGEFMRRAPEFAAALMASNPNGPYIPTTPMTMGKMVMVSDVGACSLCRKTLERVAARAPSYAHVEFDDAERFADKPTIQVAR